MSAESDQSNIITFSNTQLLCIEEKGRYNDHRYKLSYYSYPLQKTIKNRPISLYEAKDDEWTIECFSFKANNHSMVCWSKPLLSGCI